MFSYLIAFGVGGAICALSQVLMDKTKMMPGRVMVLLVCMGALLNLVGLYDGFVNWAGAGASVPLLGFGNVLMQGVKDGIQESGLLGLFQGGLTAGSAGTAAALIFGLITSLFFNARIKK